MNCFSFCKNKWLKHGKQSALWILHSKQLKMQVSMHFIVIFQLFQHPNLTWTVLLMTKCQTENSSNGNCHFFICCKCHVRFWVELFDLFWKRLLSQMFCFTLQFISKEHGISNDSYSTLLQYYKKRTKKCFCFNGNK